MSGSFAEQLESLCRPEPEAEPVDEDHALWAPVAERQEDGQWRGQRAPALRVANAPLLDQADQRYAVVKTDRATHFGDRPPSPDDAHVHLASDDDGGSSPEHRGESESDDEDAANAGAEPVVMDVALVSTAGVVDGARKRKASAIVSQRRLWEQLVGARIKLQPALHAANRLPAAGDHWAHFATAAHADTRRTLAMCQRELSTALGHCVQLEDALLRRNKRTRRLTAGGEAKADNGGDASEASAGGSDLRDELDKMSVAGDDDAQSDDVVALPDDSDAQSGQSGTGSDAEAQTGGNVRHKSPRRTAWGQQLAERHRRYIAYRNEVLRKWHDKTRGASTAGSKRDFSQFNADVVRQIDNVVSDGERLVKRATARRPEQASRLRPAAHHGGGGGGAAAAADGDSGDTFDDDDFYEQLLNELIDAKSAGASVEDGATMTRQWLQLQRLRRKKQKSKCVDTKASKGRRVRHDVMQKLINYMAPAPPDAWSDRAKDELFASLFA